MDINFNIYEIMDSFSKNNRIFQSEAQLQFDLAWKIQEKIGNSGEVLLEVMSMEDENKRFYSDIIVKYNSGEFVAIELKYKTKKDTFSIRSQEINLRNHGAEDCGRYDYLWDIKRLQLLKNKDNQSIINIKYGYAVILTNENKYWEYNKNKAKSRNPLYLNFCIGEGDSIPTGKLEWNYRQDTDKSTHWTKTRPPFTLDELTSKTFNWTEYYKESNEKQFKYMIIEV